MTKVKNVQGQNLESFLQMTEEMARARYDARPFSNQTTGLPNRGVAARIAGSFFSWAPNRLVPPSMTKLVW